MSQSLHHAVGVREGYEYLKSEYGEGCVRFFLLCKDQWVSRKGRRFCSWILAFLLAACSGFSQTNNASPTQKTWFEARTSHFDIYSCASRQDIDKLAARLEQFCKAYSLLAGTDAVASPPTVVIAFPDHETMKPFLPLYQGYPANISGFFKRGSDENLIVLSLSDSSGMETIFHEYAHLLFRRYDLIWPIWLKEGMAEIYSTFQVSGREIQIARPIGHHLQLLAHEPLIPLHELFSVTPDSPQYNESSRQGIFYAESWLLTHYLSAGGNPTLKVRFRRFAEWLTAGQMPEQAFTNILGISLPQMERELQRYMAQGEFPPITLSLPSDVSSPVYVTTRIAAPVEIDFRLGDELLRIDRPDTAKFYFNQAEKIAPASPLPHEGLGLLAAEQGRDAEAIQEMEKSLQLGSTGFLTHYVYAKEKFRLLAYSDGRYSRIKNSAAAAGIRRELEKSLALMPTFAATHELLGIFEAVQGEDLATAEKQLQQAIQLEPENSAYLLSLAQVQLQERYPDVARRTLQPLLSPNVDVKLRKSAEEIMQQIDRRHPAN